MMNSIFEKSNWTVFIGAGILFVLFAAGPVFADYSGHVASFKSEKNAVVFVHKMKAKGLTAYYQKEEIPGKGEFYRAYIGKYKTMALAQKALAKLKKSGEIESFAIRKAEEKDGYIETKETKTVALKNEPIKKSEDKTEIVAKKEEPAGKPENKPETAQQKSDALPKPEKKAETVAKLEESAQKPENKTETAGQKSESIQQSDKKVETIAKTDEPLEKLADKPQPAGQKDEAIQKSENKTESAILNNEPVQKQEIKAQAVEKKNETVPKPEGKTLAKKDESAQKSEDSVNTKHYYDGIKGIVLKNGKTIKGKIISIDDNDVLKIRTRSGRISSYPFTDVEEYIMD